MDKKLDEILRKMGVSNDEFEELIQERYKEISENTYCNENSENLKYLEELTGISPKKTTLQEHTINVIKHGTESNIYSLNKTKTKVKLTNNKIQSEYKKSFLEDRIFEVEYLYKETKVLPNFKKLEIDIQELYNKTLVGGNPIYWINFLKHIINEEPTFDEEVKKEVLWKEIKAKRNNYVEELIDFFGEVPKIDRRLIQTFYAREIKKDVHYGFGKFYKILNIPVEEKIVQNKLKELMNEEKNRDANYLISLTKIKPKFEDFNNKAIDIYKKEHNDSYSLDSFSEFYGDLKPEIPEELVHQKYKYGFEHGLNYLIEKEFKYFNIKPKYHDIQTGFKTFIKNDEYEGITELENLFGVKPSKNVYKLLVNKIMGVKNG